MELVNVASSLLLARLDGDLFLAAPAEWALKPALRGWPLRNQTVPLEATG